MKAFLLATGERDNLYFLTNHYPSPMLPIANCPVITYPIELMIRHRFHDILVSLLRQPDRIEAYCETGRRWNADLTYLLQREALGSAGAIKRAQGFLTDTFLVMPGDALVEVDLTKLYEFHHHHGGVATAVLATRCDGNADMPIAHLDTDSRIRSIQNNASMPNSLCFTNVYIFEPEVLESIPNQSVFDCQTELLPRLLAEEKAIHGYVLQGYWNPLDTYAGYQTAQQDYLRSLMIGSDVEREPTHLRHPYVEPDDGGTGIWRGLNATIHPSAQLNAPVFIGAGCQIGRDATVGPNVVIGPNCIVDDGATIEASTVLPDTYIGRLVKVQKKLVSASTLIDIESETHVEVTDRLLLGSAGTQTADDLLRSIIERLMALAILILAMPFLVAFALLTWMAGGGSVLMQEPRVARSPLHTLQRGEAGTATIYLYHLRTRIDNGRYTFIGRWLEKWDFHRLPELVNVLFGELALVGVKPLAEGEVVLIIEEWQRRRFDCPAGFTGRWYTETNPNSDIDDLSVVDAYQTAMQSILDSVVQVMKTPAAWWRRRKAMDWSANQNSLQPLTKSRLPRYVDDNPLKQ